MKSSLIGQINSAYSDIPAYAREEVIKNASLAAMQLMLAAKAIGLDSCPMGGFNADAFVEAFNVPCRYIPVMLRRWSGTASNVPIISFTPPA